MNDKRDSTDAPGTTSQQQTETSPLKQNAFKKNWLYCLFWDSSGDNEHASLRTIIIYFFAFSVIVTVALLAQIYYGEFGMEPHGSVATDNLECSTIGIAILKNGGNAVDAAIASTMCLGVVNFHITGLGGGGYMMIYNHRNKAVLDIIDFHATVPNSYGNKELDVSVDGLTVGVPGLLMGMWEAHQKFGKLPWNELILPASNIAKYGFLVDQNVVLARSHLTFKSGKNENLVQLINSLKEGANVTFPELAATLELIASKGVHALYNGSLAMDIVYSVKEANGSMTLDDISQYQTSHSELLHTRFGNFDILAPGSSSGGSLLLNALDNIQFLDLTSVDDKPSVILKMSDILHDTYISFLEKHDAVPMEFEPVASQVSAVDNEDIYVVVVSGLNTWLGSQLLTGAGFILNNALLNGGINDERRPLSFSTPIIALESDEVCGKRLVLGSGDPTVAAQVLTNALVLNYSLPYSVESPRFFIDKIPRHIKVEDKHAPFYDPDSLKKLESLMKIDEMPLPYKSINVIEKVGDSVTPYSDSRGGGQSFNFK